MYNNLKNHLKENNTRSEHNQTKTFKDVEITVQNVTTEEIKDNLRKIGFYVDEDASYMGLFNQFTNTIYISKLCSEQVYKKVLRHELIHFFIFNFETIDSFGEEELCDFISIKFDELCELFALFCV